MYYVREDKMPINNKRRTRQCDDPAQERIDDQEKKKIKKRHAILRQCQENTEKSG